MPKRKSIPIAEKRTVLHEAGYQCSNPVCRTIITLDLHHLVYVAQDGKNVAENLLALCPNCHALLHKGIISLDSLRTWKMLQLSLNEAFDKKSINMLLTFAKRSSFEVSGEGVFECAPLISADLLTVRQLVATQGAHCMGGPSKAIYQLKLTEKGKLFLEAWKKGDQKAAIQLNLDDHA